MNGKTMPAGGGQGLHAVGYLDCAGGGQVEAVGETLFVAHMEGSVGTSIVDVFDPAAPAVIAQIPARHGGSVHSHKVQVAGGLLLRNCESRPSRGRVPDDFVGGLEIFDLADPQRPELLHFWPCGGRGVHRFTFDGRHAYLSPEMDGYVGNIVLILDLADPCAPLETGRWWIPGQWAAGDERPTWRDRDHRVHHPIRMGERLYVSCWHAGLAILDISDMSVPRLVSRLDYHPPSTCPTHTALPVPFRLGGRRWLVAADEDVAKREPSPGAYMWLVDISDERQPRAHTTWQVPGMEQLIAGPMEGCHQPDEHLRGPVFPVAWFAQGVQLLDISEPDAIRRVAWYRPDAPPGCRNAQSNDVCTDDRGFIHVIDRQRGLTILERRP